MKELFKVENEVKVVHCQKEHYDIYIGRDSRWGNPFTHLKTNSRAKYIVETRDLAIESYRNYILNGEGKHLLKNLHELRGKTLGCWCKPKSCHGDILKELVEYENSRPPIMRRS